MGLPIAALSKAKPLQGVANMLGTAKGVFDYFGAKKDEAQARKELDRLKPTFYKIQDEFNQNRNIAGELAQSGLPESTKSYYTTEAQRGLGSSLQAITEGGGSPNDAGRLMDIYGRSVSNIAAADADSRIKNIGAFMDANKEMAGQKITQWTLNEYAPYQRRLKELTQRIDAAKQNKNTGLNTAIAGLATWGTNQSNKDLMQNLFKNQQQAGTGNDAGTNAAVTGILSGVAAGRGSSAASALGSGALQGGANAMMPNNGQAPINIFDESVNPYGENGYFDGTMWIQR